MKTVYPKNLAAYIATTEKAWVIELRYYANAIDPEFLKKNNLNAYSPTLIQKSAPFLSLDDTVELGIDNNVWVVCESEEEARMKYESIYGDESPRDDSKIAINAILFNPQGEAVTENS